MFFAKHLREEEEPILVLRQFFPTLWFKLFISFILISGAFFLIFPLFEWGLPGKILFVFLTVVGIIYACRTLYIWYFNSYILTNLRIINYRQVGFFHYSISDIALENIQKISHEIRGLCQTLLRYGSIKIQGGTSGEMALEKIARPETVHSFFLDYKGKAGKTLSLEEKNDNIE